MNRRSIVPWLAAGVCCLSVTVRADILSHNGTPNSMPPGTGEVDVFMFNVVPPGSGVGPSLVFSETAGWTMDYAYEPGEPPVTVDLFLDENDTDETWYALRVDLVGADFVFVDGTPVPDQNPVGVGVNFTRQVVCSGVTRSGADASLVLYMNDVNAVPPGDGGTLSFYAAGAGTQFTLTVTPVTVYSDSDGNGVPDECEGGGGDPVGSCCDECLGECEDGVTEDNCPSPSVWTEGADCADVCPVGPLDCDDGAFCTGVESCDAGDCVSSGDPCAAPMLCDEDRDECVECLADEDCDDGVFCNGVEMCVEGTCESPGDPCAPPLQCDEEFGDCVECVDDEDCEDGNTCTVGSCDEGACVLDPADEGVSCSDGEFCNGEEVCDGFGQCVSGDAPCDEGQDCDEVADVCASAGEATLCATLGNHRHRRWWWRADVDVYRFHGTEGETVVLTLEADGDHKGRGRAGLVLRDRIRGARLKQGDFSALPNELSVTLPATGEYRVRVVERRWHRRHQSFQGPYCLTLESSHGAADTFEPLRSVE